MDRPTKVTVRTECRNDKAKFEDGEIHTFWMRAVMMWPEGGDKKVEFELTRIDTIAPITDEETAEFRKLHDEYINALGRVVDKITLRTIGARNVD